MPNYRQPVAGETITGPLNVLDTLDNSYSQVLDAQGVVSAPQIPYVRYAKPIIASLGTPTGAQVLTLCQNLAPLVAQEIVRQSALVSRVTVLPQVTESGGYTGSGPTSTFNYTFGSTAVGVTVNTRAYIGEKVPVDVVLGNVTMTADLARRLGSGLQSNLDSQICSMWSQFNTNAAQGTAGSGGPLGGTAAAMALLAITGEPIFFAAAQGQMGLTGHGAVANGVVNEFFDPTAAVQNLALGSAPIFPSGGPGFWILTTPYVAETGTSPIHTHNLMFTPSALALLFETETNINNTNTTPIANCVATGSYGNVSVTVWALNTGSGVQAIYASIAYGLSVGINANGVQVTS